MYNHQPCAPAEVEVDGDGISAGKEQNSDWRRQGLPGHAVSSETRSHLHPSQGCRQGTYSTGDFFPDRAATASSHKKGDRSCWVEINSCHSTLGFQPGTTGKLLPCFSNSLFTHLTWQKQHKRGQQQNRFPGHLMGIWTSYRHLHSPSSPPAFPSSPPGLPLPRSPTCGAELFGAAVVSHTVSAQWPSPLHHLHPPASTTTQPGGIIWLLYSWHPDFILRFVSDTDRWPERCHDKSHKQYYTKHHAPLKRDLYFLF